MANIFPCRDIGILGSYNIHSPQDALEETLIKLVQDIAFGRSCKSTNLLRSIHGGIDDLKCLYLVAENLPLLAIPIVTAQETGSRVVVVGNRDVGSLCAIINEALGSTVEWVDEGQELSLTSTFQKVGKAFDFSDERLVSVSTGDIIRFNHFPDLIDPQIATHDFVYTFNVKERMPKITNRNYYLTFHPWGIFGYLLTPFMGGPVHAKEGNQLMVKPAVIESAFELFDIYKSRKGNSQAGGILDILKKKIPIAPAAFFKVVLPASLYTLFHTQKKSHLFPFPTKLDGDALFLLLNNHETQYVGVVKTGFEAYCHQDPLKMWDMDALEDLSSMRYAFSCGLLESYPQKAQLQRVQQAVASHKTMMPIVEHFDEMMAGKVKEYEQGLKRFPHGFSTKSHELWQSLSPRQKSRVRKYTIPKSLEMSANGFTIKRLKKYMDGAGRKAYTRAKNQYHAYLSQ